MSEQKTLLPEWLQDIRGKADRGNLCLITPDELSRLFQALETEMRKVARAKEAIRFGKFRLKSFAGEGKLHQSDIDHNQALEVLFEALKELEE